MTTILPLYIDPGTGSMLFSLFIAVAAALSFVLRAVFLKVKFILNGGKVDEKDKNTIPFVIFSDHKRYWNVFEPVCDEFEKRKIPLVFYTASPDDPALAKKYEYIKTEFIGEGNKAFAKLNFLHADVLLSTTPGLDVYQWKRSKYVKWYVHVPHTVDDLSGYRMFGLDFYDAVLTTGENQKNLVQKIENMRSKINKKEIQIVGSPYMDVMNKKACDVMARTKNKTTTTVLVAPSWGQSSLLAKYGLNFLQQIADTGYEIIVRPHPQSTVSEKEMLGALRKETRDIKNLSWNFDNDNFSVLAQSDILISDYSGIMYEYVFLFDRPIFYTNEQFDSSIYDACWLESSSWNMTVLPRLGKELRESDFSNIKQIIDETITSENLARERSLAKNEAWQYVGEGAVRIADYLIKKRDEILEDLQLEQKPVA